MKRYTNHPIKRSEKTSMMWNKKIHAFTLVEMLVAMAMSVIVVGLVYAVLNLIYGNIATIQGNYYASTKIDLLSQQLKADLNKYSTAFYENGTRHLLLKSPIDSLIYEFEDYGIIRQKDTLWNGPYVSLFYFQGRQMNSGYIDALKIVIKDDDRENLIFQIKELDAAVLMNIDGN